MPVGRAGVNRPRAHRAGFCRIVPNPGSCPKRNETVAGRRLPTASGREVCGGAAGIRLPATGSCAAPVRGRRKSWDGGSAGCHRRPHGCARCRDAPFSILSSVTPRSASRCTARVPKSALEIRLCGPCASDVPKVAAATGRRPFRVLDPVVDVTILRPNVSQEGQRKGHFMPCGSTLSATKRNLRGDPGAADTSSRAAEP
jgi:hypothetical protein